MEINVKALNKSTHIDNELNVQPSVSNDFEFHRVTDGNAHRGRDMCIFEKHNKTAIDLISEKAAGGIPGLAESTIRNIEHSLLSYYADRQARYACAPIIPRYDTEVETGYITKPDIDEARRLKTRIHSELAEQPVGYEKELRVQFDARPRSERVEIPLQALSSAYKTGKDPYSVALRTLAMQCYLEQESRFDTLISTDANFGETKALASGERWTDSQRASTNPIDELVDFRDNIQINGGEFPNTMVMGLKVWDALSQHPDVLAQLPNLVIQPGQGARKLTFDALASILSIQHVYITGATINRSPIHGAPDIERVGDNQLIMFTAPEDNMVEDGDVTWAAHATYMPEALPGSTDDNGCYIHIHQSARSSIVFDTHTWQDMFIVENKFAGRMSSILS